MSGLPGRVLGVLLVHERYAQAGGEDQVVETDAAHLSRHGHDVSRWSVDNREISAWSALKKARLAWRTTWSAESYRTLEALIQARRPDVVHFHNTLPIISPAAIVAAHAAGTPVVMTLHNYRLLCPVATLFRDGKVCEDCHRHSLARSVLHGCYRDSRFQSSVVAAMLAAHRRLGTWSERVDAYVALTGFMRSKMIEGGLPAARVHVRGNPVDPPEATPAYEDYALFVGRLSAEKGIACLLEAVRSLNGVAVRIVGTGPLEPAVRDAGGGEVLGYLPHERTLEVIARARVLIFPSLWYEGLPRSIVEAFACGVPVVASRLGAMAEIVTDGHDGFLVAPGDAAQLADRVKRLMTDDALRERMGRAARATYQARYSVERCYERLMEIYGFAIASAKARRAAA